MTCLSSAEIQHGSTQLSETQMHIAQWDAIRFIPIQLVPKQIQDGAVITERQEEPSSVSVPASLRCPLCADFCTQGPAQILMSHLIRRHAGHVLSKRSCEILCGSNHGACSRCGIARHMSCRSCRHDSDPSFDFCVLC